MATKKKKTKSDLNGEPIPEQTEIERSREQSRFALRRKVRIFYDLQRLRLQTAGRTVEKEDPGKIQLHPADVAVLDLRAQELHNAEKNALKDVEDHLKSLVFYQNVLSDKTRFRGIGPTMAGVILSEFDIHREDTPSKMWSFAGLAPIPARRCVKCHAVLKEADGVLTHPAKQKQDASKGPIDKSSFVPKCELKDPIPLGSSYESAKSARPVRGEKLRYNSFLRSKLCGVLGPVMLQLNSPWRKCYDDYKHRKASAGWGVSDGHRHQAAIRYMIKMLLLDIWKDWRGHEGLPIRPSYQEEKLGHTHSGGKAIHQNGFPGHISDISPEVLAEMEAMNQ